MTDSTNQFLHTTDSNYHTHVQMNEYKNYPILMAEDNPDDILITQRAWKKGKFKNKLYVVNNGEEALDFLYRRGQFADAPPVLLLLLDLNMPRMNGFDVLEILKKDPKMKRMPVIVLTTSNRNRDIEQAYELGCNSYIVKPVGFDNFLHAVIELQRYWIYLSEIPNNEKRTQSDSR